jgi:TfoX/Sxy family transcriptional regulator of competence genes
MASDESFVAYVRDQASGARNISFRKMFGEYAIYCGNKVVALICDNQVFVKPTAAGRALLIGVVESPPYPGAKPHFLVSDLNDGQFVAKLLLATERELPEPKPKPKAKSKKKTAKSTKRKTTQRSRK